MGSRDQLARLVTQEVMNKPLKGLEEPDRWTGFYVAETAKFAGKSALETMTSWSDELLEDVYQKEEADRALAFLTRSGGVTQASLTAAQDKVNAANAALTALRASKDIFSVLLQTSTRKAVEAIKDHYRLHLEPFDRPAEVDTVSYEAARDEFDRVYKQKLAELSVKDPYVKKPCISNVNAVPCTTRRPRRTRDELYPEELAYVEGEKAYNLKLSEMVPSAPAKTTGGRKRRRTHKVAGKRRRRRYTKRRV